MVWSGQFQFQMIMKIDGIKFMCKQNVSWDNAYFDDAYVLNY